jgi:hypothetical protein
MRMYTRNVSINIQKENQEVVIDPTNLVLDIRGGNKNQ